MNKPSQQYPGIFPDAWRGCGLSAAQGTARLLRDIPENQTIVLSIPGGTGGEQGWGQRPWEAAGQPGTLLSQAGAAGRTFQPQSPRQSAEPRARRAVTASLHKDTGAHTAHPSTVTSLEIHLGLYPGKKKGKTKSRAALTGAMLLIGTALPPWHPGQGCRLCPAPAGVRACRAHPGQVLEEGKGLGTSSSLETEPSPASRAGSAQPRLR